MPNGKGINWRVAIFVSTVVFLGGVAWITIYFNSTAIAENAVDIKEQKQLYMEDHERLIRVEITQQQIKGDVKDIKEMNREILRRLP